MSTILEKIKSVKLCLMPHPDNEVDSEFSDRISDLQEIENELSKDNNGWIKGFPNKEGGEFWTMIEDIEYPIFVTSVNCYDEFWGDILGDTICFKQSQITHYQPISKPILPLY